MASVLGGRRWLWLALLATLACFGAVGVALLACGGHVLHGTNTSTDVPAVTEVPGPPRADANALATETKGPPREDTSATAADSSSSPCATVTGSYGACDGVLGWGFDGKVCRQLRGCDCAPDCARLFPTARACAQVCRMQGACNTEALVSQGIARFEIGRSCDSLLACVPAGLEGELGLDLAGDCKAGGVCANVLTCMLQLPIVIDQAQWDRYCTASLISGVRIECAQSLL